jgi:UDP-N-acetyl-D-glucosamine dehydrogenase
VIARALNQEGRALNGARVLVCGVAYKPNVGDARESPAIKLMGLLLREGARVRYHDPHVGYVPEHDLESTPLDPGECDVAVIVTDHDDLDLDALLDEAPVVVDLRNATRGRPSRARIERL